MFNGHLRCKCLYGKVWLGGTRKGDRSDRSKSDDKQTGELVPYANNWFDKLVAGITVGPAL